jgi:hypothetical protein
MAPPDDNASLNDAVGSLAGGGAADTASATTVVAGAETRTSPFAEGAYTVEKPVRQTGAAVFASPHSGCCYPADFVAASRLDATALRRS